MPPSPIPAPLPPWAKAALWIAPFAFGYLEGLLTHAEAAAPSDEWRRVQLHWRDLMGPAVPANDRYCGYDIVNITGGAIDSTWTDADYASCEAKLNTFLTSMAPITSGITALMEYRWYRRSFNGYDDVKPFPDSGPPLRVTPHVQMGAAPTMPAQVALSITEKTAWPKHWGRFYWPIGGGTTIIDTLSGHVAHATVDAAATATSTLYAALAGADFVPVVPVTQVDKVAARALLTVSQIQVDDVFDVIRRRRPKAPDYRKILP